MLNKIYYNLKEIKEEGKKEGIKVRRKKYWEVVIWLKTFKNDLVTIMWNNDVFSLNVQFSLNKFSLLHNPHASVALPV